MAKQKTQIYRHDFDGEAPDSESLRLANEAPPWRRFASKNKFEGDFKERRMSDRQILQGKNFRATAKEARMVDAALVLRRPLLIEGDPGIGKTSLAYSIAWQLGLGDVFKWSITSRSTRKDALYQYDAIARLQDSSLAGKSEGNGQAAGAPTNIGKYLTLGPLGSALVPNGDGPYQPRVLLIDEIDKSDIDLPNDLLHVLEEGSFEIPEIKRLQLSEPAEIRLHNSSDTDEPFKVPPTGRIVCDDFPLVIMTTNGEREFSPAFKRRCLTLKMERPEEEKLRSILDMHFEGNWSQDNSEKQLKAFLTKLNNQDQVAVDQLLNAVYLTSSNADVNPEHNPNIKEAVLKSLSDD